MKRAIRDIDLTVDPFSTSGYLIDFLCKEFEARGFARAVMGLSGGVDSALGLALAVNALGARSVTALAMPATQSSPQSLADAREVAGTFGVRLLVKPIGAIVRGLLGREKNPGRLRIGNAAARARMMRLFDHSQQHRALVIGTSNKTELLLGYGTWYGDVACSLNPLGDLYKTQVRQLAGFLGVPERVLSKAPSADLWKGQTDEAELGLAYDEVDRLLYLMIDRAYSDAALQALGFSRRYIRRVQGIIARSEFKRALPAIPKLTRRTVAEFRLPRNWKA